MSKVKKFKVKEISGRFGEFIYLGANAENVDILLDNEDGTKSLQDLQSYIGTLEDTLKNLKILTSELKEETTTFKSNIEELSLNDATEIETIKATITKKSEESLPTVWPHRQPDTYWCSPVPVLQRRAR